MGQNCPRSDVQTALCNGHVGPVTAGPWGLVHAATLSGVSVESSTCGRSASFLHDPSRHSRLWARPRLHWPEWFQSTGPPP